MRPRSAVAASHPSGFHGVMGQRREDSHRADREDQVVDGIYVSSLPNSGAELRYQVPRRSPQHLSRATMSDGQETEAIVGTFMHSVEAVALLDELAGCVAERLGTPSRAAEPWVGVADRRRRTSAASRSGSTTECTARMRPASRTARKAADCSSSSPSSTAGLSRATPDESKARLASTRPRRYRGRDNKVPRRRANAPGPARREIRLCERIAHYPPHR